MKIAVVILNWNGEAYLRQFLPLLIERTPNPGCEIIVADNASTDCSMEVMQTQFPTVRTIRLDQNYGFAGGYNKALSLVDAEYYVLLNSDVEVTANWLSPLLDYMEINPNTAACQPKIKAYHDKKSFEHAGAAGGYIDKYGFPFCKGRIFGVVEQDNGQYDEISSIFWASGACLMIRSNVYQQAGGLDEDFFAHMEEIDLCWRIKNMGYEIVCIPDSEVFHIGGGTLNTESPRKTYLNFRNNQLMLFKNLPDSSLRKILIYRWFFDYAAAFQLFVSGKRANACSVYKARRDFKKLISKYRIKRREVQIRGQQKEIPEIYQSSIVFAYYLKKKQLFSLLNRYGGN